MWTRLPTDRSVVLGHHSRASRARFRSWRTGARGFSGVGTACCGHFRSIPDRRGADLARRDLDWVANRGRIESARPPSFDFARAKLLSYRLMMALFVVLAVFDSDREHLKFIPNQCERMDGRCRLPC